MSKSCVWACFLMVWALLPRQINAQSHLNTQPSDFFFQSQLALATQLNTQGEYDQAIAELTPLCEDPRWTESVSAELQSDGWELLGKSHLYLGAFEPAKAAFVTCIDLRTATLGADHPKTAIAYQRLGECWYVLRDERYHSRACFEWAVSIFQGHSDTEAIDFSKLLIKLGYVYLDAGNPTRALQTLQQALAIRRQELGETHHLVANAWMAVGEVYFAQDDYDRTFSHWQRSLSIRQNLPNPDLYQLSGDYNNLAVVLDAMEKRDSALIYYEKALTLRLKALPEDHPAVGDIYYSKAVALGHQKAFLQAHLEMDKAARIVQTNFGIKSPEMADIQKERAWLLKHGQDTVRALNAYHAALLSLVPEFTDSDWSALPPLFTTPYEIELLKIVLGKANLWLHYTQSNASPKTENLLSILDLYTAADSLTDHIRIDFITDQSKLSFLEQSNQLYGPAVAVCHGLWEATGEAIYLEKGFYFSEKGKAMVLYDALRASSISKSAGIPERIREAERQLKNALMEYEFTLSTLDPETQPDRYRECLDSLSTLNLRIERIQEGLARHFPAYETLKQGIAMVEMEELQVRLAKEQQSLIEYVAVEDGYFLFGIAPDTMIFEHILVDTIDALALTEVKQFCRNPQLGGNTAEIQADFVKKAYKLYTHLLAPGLPGSLTYISRLLIVPEGELEGVPFEMLISDPELPTFPDYTQLAYVIKKAAIGYAWSATLWMHESVQPAGPGNGQCLAFAWSEATEKGGNQGEMRSLKAEAIADLPGSAWEVQAIAPFASGKYQYGDSATEAVFKSEAEAYSLLHLAVHGEVNHEEPMKSALRLHPDARGQEDGQLFVSELFSMNLKADLAVLSACETGIGKQAPGEGMLTIGRGFRYAGVPAVVASLWKVNDQVTSQIMAVFYENLSEGIPKDIALQQAKLTYLNQADGMSGQPYYWAAFKPMGEMKPVKLHRNQGRLLWGLVLGILGLIGMGAIVLRRQARKKKQI